MSEKFQGDTQIEGADTFLLEKGVDTFFNGDRKLTLASANISTLNQVSNMVKNQYKVAVLDNGNLITVTRQSKVIRTENSNTKTGISASELTMPHGRQFVENLQEKLNARTLQQLSRVLGIDESALEFVKASKEVPSRFVIFVSLRTDLSPKQLLCTVSE